MRIHIHFEGPELHLSHTILIYFRQQWANRWQNWKLDSFKETVRGQQV